MTTTFPLSSGRFWIARANPEQTQLIKGANSVDGVLAVFRHRLPRAPSVHDPPRVGMDTAGPMQRLISMVTTGLIIGEHSEILAQGFRTAPRSPLKVTEFESCTNAKLGAVAFLHGDRKLGTRRCFRTCSTQ